MPTFETTEGKTVQPAGVYRHKETGQELVVQRTEKFGNPQADAIMRMGFEYVGPAALKDPSEDDKKGTLYAAPDPTISPAANTDPTTVKSVNQLEAELAEAKAREAQARKASIGTESLVDKQAVKDQNKTSSTTSSTTTTASTSTTDEKGKK